MTWTDERVETLKKLWTEGLSASQIAAELGGITRNAVIGKVHRLGLSGRAKSPSSAAPRPRKARPHSHMLRVSRPSIRGNTALAQAYELEIELEPELVDNVIPLGQRRTLLELNEETCRWPIGDPGHPDFFFCGGQTITGLPYCAYHSRVAYQPAHLRRDRRPFRSRSTTAPLCPDWMPPAGRRRREDVPLAPIHFAHVGRLQSRRLPKPIVKRVAGAADGADRIGIVTAVERLAQPADMDVDGALVDIDFAAPHAVGKLFAREHATGPLHQEFEQTIFGRPEIDPAAAARPPLLLPVDLEVAERQHVGEPLG